MQQDVANARERKMETTLLERVGLFLCSDARGRKIVMLNQGWGFGVLWGDEKRGTKIRLDGITSCLESGRSAERDVVILLRRTNIY